VLFRRFTPNHAPGLNLLKIDDRCWPPLIGLGVASAAACLAVSALRFGTLAFHSDVVETTGGEGPCIYGIWKVARGFSLYEDPDKGNYALTLYNYLFYYAYGLPLKAALDTGHAILLWGRFISMFAAVAGAIGEWMFIRDLARGNWSPTKGFLSACLCIPIWLGPLAGWYPFSNRPDMLALAFVAWGLFSYWRGISTEQVWLAVAGSLFFFLAWSVKQSAVWIFAGLLMYLALSRPKMVHVLALVLPFSFLASAALGLGSAVYRHNILWAPSISRFGLAILARNAVLALASDPFAWMFCGVFILVGRKAMFLRIFGARAWSLFWSMACVTLLMCSLACAKDGSSQNHFLEAAVALSAFAIAALITVARTAPSLIRVSALALLLATAVLPTLQALFPWGLDSRLGWHSLRITNAADLARRHFAAGLKRLPKPIFTDDDIFAMPWYSTDDHHPAFSIDHVFYDEAQRQGKLKDGGIAFLVRQRYFGSLVIDADNQLLADALACGYVREGPPRSVPQAFQSWNDSSFIILLRPESGRCLPVQQ
jgi:hypothetical protein